MSLWNIRAKRMPIVLQDELSECGLACLAMISGYFGRRIGLRAIRDRCDISSRGQTLQSLILAGDQLGLSSRAVKVKVGQLHRLKTPCIVHWRFDHFVVLKSIRRNKVEVHDPAVGSKTMSVEDFFNSFTGVALEMTPNDRFEKSEVAKGIPIGSLFKNAVGLKRALVMVLSVSIILQVLSLLSPLYIKYVVDEAISVSDSDLLLVLAIGFSLLLLLDTLVASVRDSLVLQLSSQLYSQTTYNLFNHLIKLPLDYFQRRNLGDILSKFYSIDAIRHALTSGAIVLLIDGFMAGALLVAMFIFVPQLALIVLSAAFLLLLVHLLTYPPIRTLTQKHVNAEARAQSFFMESVKSIQVIKVFQLEVNREQRWKNLFAKLINYEIARTYWGIGNQATSKLIAGLENILVVYIGATLVMAGNITTGTLFAFLAYKLRFGQSYSDVVKEIFRLRVLSVHLSRLADIVFAKKDFRFNDGAHKSTRDRIDKISVSSLAFKYSAQEPFVFENINFEVLCGEAVAIVGKSGSGKTTLLKCLMGLLEPSKGQLYVNEDESQPLSSYAHQMSSVMQDDQLLSGSISDNISGFQEEVDIERVAMCAKTACIHDEIMLLPMGYRTHIGDIGHTLSEGQKQRLILARALYRQPLVLFMDEATSNLDVATEVEINNNLAKTGVTRIFVAHRPDTIRFADRKITLP